jgi:prepilin-type processing-associated H-X9-DG protein
LLTDSFLDGGWKFGFNGYGSDFTSFVGNPHAGKRGNVLWADGHVTSQEISQIESKNVWPSTL